MTNKISIERALAPAEKIGFNPDSRVSVKSFRVPKKALTDGEWAFFCRELIEFVPAVVFCHDMADDNRCLFVSKSFEEIWGIPRSELSKNPQVWNESVVPEDRDLVREQFHNNTEPGRAQEFEYRIRDAAGQLRYIEGRFINLPNTAENSAHRIGFATDITDRRLAEMRAYENSQLDSVTGLANRHAFSETLAELLTSRTNRSKSGAMYLVFVDIDRFSRVNDTLGHSVGDEYLRKIAVRITSFIGPSGFVARIGGDEFAIILTDCAEPSAARGRLLGLKQALNQPISVDGEQIVTSASCGVASYPADGDDPGSLMKAAELAMVKGKSLCRGSLTFFHPELTLKGCRTRLRRDMDLRKALFLEQYELFYQGKYNGMTQQLEGAEVLLRWHHPAFGLISPAEFIPQLEDSGDIIEVGYWIIEKACTQLATWASSRLRDNFTLAVNVSAAQLLSPDFTQTVIEIVERHGIAPEKLELELTESAILADPYRAELVFADIRKAGLRIAIDDFGTGYSSMSYLRRFHPDTLKIDRSFIIGCDTDETALGIVESIIQLARTLNMTIVAEGIETTSQAKCLARAGSDLLQGFLFSRPLPCDQFEQLVGLEHNNE